MGPYRSLCVFEGAYVSLKVLMRPYGFLIVPFSCLSIPMCFNVSLYNSFCFFIRPHRSLCILMDSGWSL